MGTGALPFLSCSGVYSRSTGIEPILLDVHACRFGTTSSYGIYIGWGAPTLLDRTVEAGDRTYNHSKRTIFRWCCGTLDTQAS